MMGIFNEIVAKQKSIAIIGLGYVGLPLALEFSRKYKVVGFDINPKRVSMLNNQFRSLLLYNSLHNNIMGLFIIPRFTSTMK